MTVISWFKKTKGEFIFHLGSGRFDSFFPFKKLNYNLKTLFYLLALSLCNIKMYLMIWIFYVWQICNKQKNNNNNKTWGVQKYTALNKKNVFLCIFIFLSFPC